MGAAALGVLAAVPNAWAARLLSATPRIGPGSFLDSVASGEPTPTAMTFWSRLTTDRPRSGARLIVALDEGLSRVVASPVVPTGDAMDHCLKTRVDGLEPGTVYYYAWQSGDDVSPIGRTRTAPGADSRDTVRLATSSCQNFDVGFYTGLSHAAAQPDLDLVLFLGDYTYETPGQGVRRDPLHSNDLASYREKLRINREDVGLRELHRLHPMTHIWDDHEVADNYSDNDPAASPLQRAAAYRAAFEWMPRMVFPRERHRIYTRIPYGRTAEVFLLDERQYRTGDGDGQPRRILGEEQMAWLIDGLKSSPARWKVIAQQVVVATINYGPAVNSDAWDGYTADRTRLLGELERAGIDDVVFLTGDVHVFMANLLASDFAALGSGSSRKPAATEYVGGSITTPGIDQPEQAVQARNPWNKQYDGRQHGYAHLDMDAARLVTDYRTTAYLVPDGPTASFERFTQPAGTNQIQRQRLPHGRARVARAQRGAGAHLREAAR